MARRRGETGAVEVSGGRRGRGRYGMVEVDGPSMVPTLEHGDWLLVRYGARVRPGDVVILRHPFQQDLLVVKRAVERREGGWWVLGDNAFAGGDSTVYGVVPRAMVLARVTARLRPRGAAGPGREPVRGVRGTLGWAYSAVRPVRSDVSLSRRLRAR
ncbi:nickel-type superoxide dismutase maturation protease [Streptomyces sp. NPDC058374]|uniref:nickel-type superoxide dismutase maturation protease n=1 Tax=unclassified Streptomyces TaxID=2593676 RepID=UPI0036641C71